MITQKLHRVLFDLASGRVYCYKGFWHVLLAEICSLFPDTQKPLASVAGTRDIHYLCVKRCTISSAPFLYTQAHQRAFGVHGCPVACVSIVYNAHSACLPSSCYQDGRVRSDLPGSVRYYLAEPAKSASITAPATLDFPIYATARFGGLRGAVGMSTASKIAVNIDRGF